MPRSLLRPRPWEQQRQRLQESSTSQVPSAAPSASPTRLAQQLVCYFIPEACPGGIFIGTVDNDTSSSNETADSAANSTVTPEHVLEALATSPRACELVPELCELMGQQDNTTASPYNDTIIANATAVPGDNNNSTELPQGGSPGTPAPFSLAPTSTNAPTDEHVPTAAPLTFAPADSISSSITSVPTFSATPTGSPSPTVTIGHPESHRPSSSNEPSHVPSFVPSASPEPTLSYTPSLSLAPSTTSEPTFSNHPSLSQSPSVTPNPSESFPPTAAPSLDPSSRSCPHWQLHGAEETVVDFSYTVQITSLAATFLSEMESLLLNQVANQVLQDCGPSIHIVRVSYPDPASRIGACDISQPAAKSCWTVDSQLQLWHVPSQTSAQAQAAVTSVIRHEFDFGQAVQDVIPNSVSVELQVPEPWTTSVSSRLSSGAAVSIMFLLLVLVLILGAALKVRSWQALNQKSLIQRSNSSYRNQDGFWSDEEDEEEDLQVMNDDSSNESSISDDPRLQVLRASSQRQTDIGIIAEEEPVPLQPKQAKTVGIGHSRIRSRVYDGLLADDDSLSSSHCSSGDTSDEESPEDVEMSRPLPAIDVAHGPDTISVLPSLASYERVDDLGPMRLWTVNSDPVLQEGEIT